MNWCPVAINLLRKGFFEEEFAGEEHAEATASGLGRARFFSPTWELSKPMVAKVAPWM
jgi:hypothetical protein